MPFHDNTKLTILDVVPSRLLDMPKEFTPQPNERMIEITEKIRSMRLSTSERILPRARRSLSKKFRYIDVLLEAGDPSETILNVAETLKPDLIAVGCRGLRGFKGMLGSVSRNILAHSKCSILIGKTCQK